MRIFVTGGTGFIGGHFINLAQEKGHDVVALRRPESKSRINLQTEPNWYEAELNNVDDEVLSSCGALFHFAAQGVSPQKTDWLTSFDVNVQQSLALMIQADRLEIPKIVCCGSCFEYGLSGTKYNAIPVDAPLQPVGPYATSKVAFTIALEALARSSKSSWALLRPFHLYGEGQNEANFWPSIKKAALGGENFTMTLGEQVRDYMCVKDACRVFLGTIAQSEEAGELMVKNVGSGIPTTMRDFALEWWAHWGAKGELEIGGIPYRSDEVMRFVPNLS